MSTLSDSVRYTARATVSQGIPVGVSISTSGFLGGDGSDLTLRIDGGGFFIGNANANEQRAFIRVSGDIEISTLPEILELAARMTRQITKATR